MRRDVRRGLGVVAVSGLLALGACGEDDSDGGPDTQDLLGAEELRTEIETDADRVESAAREVAPVMATAVDARIRGAFGNVEGCEGGSFDGPTAYGYQARGVLERLPSGEPQQQAEQVVEALEQAGWSEVTIEDETPGRVGVSAERGGPVVAVTFDEDMAGEALFTVRGRCLPVSDEGREAALDLVESREIIPRR